MAKTVKNMQMKAGSALTSVTATLDDGLPAIPCPEPAGYRYVGARYVPVFADSDWNSQNTYEPLTIVMYQGNSYTSKTFVPTGIDISNTTFWAPTGNYNAQVEQYKQLVESFNERITNIEDIDSAFGFNNPDTASTLRERLNDAYLITNQLINLVYIGDSWGQVESQAIPMRIGTISGLSIRNYSISGSGFITEGHNSDGSGDGTFMDQVDKAIADDQYINEAVKYVVIEGGVNDMSSIDGTPATIDAWRNEVQAVLSKCHSNFPNAKVFCFLFNAPWCLDQYNNNLYTLINYVFNMNNNWCAIIPIMNWNLGNMSIFSTSNVAHPNLSGCYIMAYKMATVINGGMIYNNVSNFLNLTNYKTDKCADTNAQFRIIDGDIYANNGGYIKVAESAEGNNAVVLNTPESFLPFTGIYSCNITSEDGGSATLRILRNGDEASQGWDGKLATISITDIRGVANKLYYLPSYIGKYGV